MRAKLTPEQQRVVACYHDDFVSSGALLDAAGSKRLAALNQELATLYTTFNQNVLADAQRRRPRRPRRRARQQRRQLAVRAEQAKLMGFPTHAQRELARAMVKTPERVMKLLETMWTPAAARGREEGAAMSVSARSQGQQEPIAPWDHRSYVVRSSAEADSRPGASVEIPEAPRGVEGNGPSRIRTGDQSVMSRQL